MGIITIVVLALTALGLGFGALWGCGRGLYRATLRLGLVLFAIILAVLLRGVVTDALMGIEVDGQPLDQMLASEMGGDGEMPESIVNLILALMKSVIAMVAFLVVYFVLRIFTWIIVYPICKIWVKKGPKIVEEEVSYEQAVENGFEGTEEEYALSLTKKKPRYKKRRGYGALVGLGQGIIVAFALIAPLTGMMKQVDKIATVEMDGKPLFELPEDAGIGEYVNSAPGKVYGTLGGWFFDTVTTVKDADGNKVNIGAAVDAVDAVMGVVGSIEDMTTNLEILGSESATDEERMDALDGLGDSLIASGNALDKLDKDSKKILEDLIGSVKDMIAQEGGSDPEMEAILEDLSLENLDLAAAGEAIKGISSFLTKTNPDYTGTEGVTQKDITAIVNGIAKNPLILGMIESMGEGEPVTFVDVTGTEYADLFANAVAAADLDADKKAVLAAFFGL